MTAPGPPEVEAEELAAAEKRMRELAAHWGRAGDLQAFAGREPYWTCARHAAALLAEYERLREQLADYSRSMEAYDRMANEKRETLRMFSNLGDEHNKLSADLARALPVVEAAGALVEHDQAKPALGKSITAWRVRRRELLDALARAVDAEIKGRES